MTALNTPVLLIAFNRPDTTRRVLDAIRPARPKKLFVAIDGPRLDVPEDQQLCHDTAAVSTTVDWDCEVHELIRDKNLGCGYAVSGAVTWFFEHVEAGIILEDDCLPDLSFFPFCEELLHHYRNSPRIMHISGNNFLFGATRGRASYYYSRFTYNWGWATWRSAWQHYDHEVADPARRAHNWDHQWRLSVQRRGGLAVLPNVNLVTNIGCGRPDATHTSELDGNYAGLPVSPMTFPLRHPRKIRAMDRRTDYSLFEPPASTRRAMWKHRIRQHVRALRRLFARDEDGAIFPEQQFESAQPRTVAEWEASGRPAPPPHDVKQSVLREYARRYNLRTFVESGTYMGDMVDAMSAVFDRIVSIELSPTLAHRAQSRFEGRRDITIFQGDSGNVMASAVKGVGGPALFWLDGHYSGGITARGDRDTPVLKELGHILDDGDVGHVIMIDDARLFGVDPAYPSVQDVEQLVRAKRLQYDVEVVDDIIRITPAQRPEPC